MSVSSDQSASDQSSICIVDVQGNVDMSDMENAETIKWSETNKNPAKIKQEPTDAHLRKKDSVRWMDTVNDEKDLLIAQLQEQVAKQRECISHYESIVQLMNYRLKKLKKVLKAHQLLGELDKL